MARNEMIRMQAVEIFKIIDHNMVAIFPLPLQPLKIFGALRRFLTSVN